MPLEPLKLRNRRSLMVLVVLIMMMNATWTTAMAGQSDEPSKTLAATVNHSAAETNAEQKENGLPQKAVEIGRVFGFPITNSMLVSWIAALALIIFVQLATRKMEQVPTGVQNFLEWLVESLYGFLEGLLGPHL